MVRLSGFINGRSLSYAFKFRELIISYLCAVSTTRQIMSLEFRDTILQLRKEFQVTKYRSAKFTRAPVTRN